MPANPPVYGYKLSPLTNAAGTQIKFCLPVGFVTPPSETNRLFVIEKSGNIAVITNLANPNRTVFLNLSNKVVSSTGTGEGGVLGLAFHPGYASNRYFFVYYVGNDTTPAPGGTNSMHNILSRFQTDAVNPNFASTNTELKLIRQYDEINSHNAGDLHFGPDEYLYGSLGDEGSAGAVVGDPQTNAQFIDKDFFSAIIRIDVDKKPGNLLPNTHPASSTNYFIPVDNPFIGTTNFNGITVNSNNVRTEFYAMGFRNPWRFTFDDVTGRLIVGDVGLKDREEINDVIKGGNYGWAFREGTTNGYRDRPPDYLGGQAPPGFSNSIPPIFEYGHYADHGIPAYGSWTNGPYTTDLGYTVIGGVFYRGDRISQLKDFYVFGDYYYSVPTYLWAFKYDGTNLTQFTRLMTAAQIVAYGTDPNNGDVLMACLTNVATFGAGASFNPILRLDYDTNTVEGTPLPATLADTGAFSDVATLTPNAGIVPYTISVPFWSDNAIKTRWFSVPNTNLTIGFNPNDNWLFPTGTVWIKHFELELTNGVPASRKRLETRLLVRNEGGVYGVTYRWGNSTTDATLLSEAGMDEQFVINDGGNLRTQVWHYPSRNECLSCHTLQGGFGLGFNTPQLNCNFDYGTGLTNQVMALSEADYFDSNVTGVHTLRSLAPASAGGVSLEYRARSYFAANCRQCHQGSSPGLWDANITTPTSMAGLINGALVDDFGDASNRVIKPGSLANSVLWQRISALGVNHMPPLATSVLDTNNVNLVAAWITNGLAGYQSFAQWQTNYFGSTNAPNAQPNADADSDRAVNELEYLTLTDPLDGTNFWQISIQRTGNQVQIVFPQIANRGFEVQYADAVTNPIDWTVLDTPDNAPFFSISNFTKTVTDDAANSSRYYRVRVYEP